ncbi:MFS transporter [Mesorhizobium sp. L-8-3]|uniref:MFS transporter n=1 Tax=Mesorhizobium sp. L-8-3 TaxID=2744522 RepID=UPI001927C682|nr:MFS transporter [Mesorhizobium sp. L-8-3]BCH21335.1 MFS transporter [Mesorhizobium sp. L-8-3]
MNWDMVSEVDRSRIRRWQIGMLALALTCEIFLAADWYAFAAVIPFISDTLRLDPAQAGLAQGIFALTYGFGMVAWSQVSRGMSARNMLLIGLLGTGLGMVLQVFVQSYGQLVALRLFIGFFDAAIFLGNMKLIIGWFPQTRRGSIVGMILAAYSLAITLDFALGIPLTIAFGWRTFFALLAGGTLLVALAIVLFGRNGPAEIGIRGFAWEESLPHGASVPLAAIFRSRWILVGGLGIAACTLAIAGTATWVVPAYIAVQQMPVEDAALVGTLMGLSQVVFLVIGGYAADRIGKAFIIKFGTALALLTAIAFSAATLVPMDFAWLLLFAGLSGIAVFGGGAIFSLLSEKYPDELATAAVGYAEVFGVISSFLSPWIMGLIIRASGGSFTQAFVAFAIAEALFLVILVVLARESSSRIGAAVPVATH